LSWARRKLAGDVGVGYLGKLELGARMPLNARDKWAPRAGVKVEQRVKRGVSEEWQKCAWELESGETAEGRAARSRAKVGVN
jgi:hypothetical protein